MSQFNVYWSALPLFIAFCLVYAASRHENWGRIWSHAARLFLMLFLAFAGITLVLFLIDSVIL